MHTAQKVIDPKISNQNTKESYDKIEIKTHWLVAQFRKLMQRQRVHEQCNQCPSFLRIPLPITPPRHICPNCTNKDAYRRRNTDGVNSRLFKVVSLSATSGKTEDCTPSASVSTEDRGTGHFLLCVTIIAESEITNIIAINAYDSIIVMT